MINTEKLRTWIEIDKSAIEKNYNTFRSLLQGDTKLACVVKSNAYGHDMLQFSKEVEKLGTDFICVDDIDEALLLRENGIKIPILVLSYIPGPRLKEAEGKNISVTISSFSKLEEVRGLELKIHIKIDSGLGRQGFLEHEMKKLVKKLIEMGLETEGLYSHFATKGRAIEIEGIYSHFANAEDPRSNYSEKQVEVFKKWINLFEENKIKVIKHISASAATMIWPEFHFDMVRVGIGVYGLWPSEETKNFIGDKIELSPALSWKTKIVEIKKLSKGSKIGYDLTEELEVDSTLAVIPVGYWYGYDRGLSSIGEVIVNGQVAKVVGKVPMCMVVIDITNIERAKIDNEVVLLGAGQSVDDIAKKVGTINYEIVTRINPIIPRIYV